jgi:4-amino-4-deoxy-L-arabinose transferase-like glycosyltransferase
MIGGPSARPPSTRPLLAGLLAVCAFAALRGVVIAAAAPPFVAPDEPAHFDYIQRLGEHRALPHLANGRGCDRFSPEVRALERAALVSIAGRPDRPLPPLAAFDLPDPQDPASRWTTGCGPAEHYPPLYYGSAAIAYVAAERGTLVQRVFAARLASVAWGVLTVGFAFLAGWWWFGRARDALLTGLIVACQPTLAFMSSVVNNDAALFACGSVAFAGIAWARRPGARARGLALLAVGCVLGVLTKHTFTVVLPAFALCALASQGVRRPRAWAATALAMTPALLASAAWALFVQRGLRNMANAAPLALPWRKFLAQSVFSSERLYFIWVKTYWMAWGYVDTFLREPYYQAISTLLALAIVGLAVGWRRLAPDERWLVPVGALSTLYVLAVMYGIEHEVLRHHRMPFVQGRYLLPLLPVHATLLVIGLRALSARLWAPVDAAWMLPAVLLVTDTAALARLLVRYYS